MNPNLGACSLYSIRSLASGFLCHCHYLISHDISCLGEEGTQRHCLVPLGLRLPALKDTLPGWVPEAALNGPLVSVAMSAVTHRAPSFPYCGQGPSAALNRKHLTVAGCPQGCCCTHCHSSVGAKEMRDHLLPPGR